MTSTRRALPILLSTVALSIGATCTFAQPTITEMPVLVGPGLVWSWATAVSADGQVVVGASCGAHASSYDFFSNPKSARWSSAGLQNLSGTGAGIALAASEDGSVVVGLSGDGGAFRWTSTSGVVILPPAAGIYTTSRATGVSRDGSIIGGYGIESPSDTITRTFRWTHSTGTQVMSAPVPIRQASLSGNGSVLVGYGNDGHAYRWVGTGPAQLVSLQAWVLGINHDGRTITGLGEGGQAFRWDYASIDSPTPTATALGVLPGPFQELCLAYATAISDDGNTIVGYGTRYAEGIPSNRFPKSAFIWRPETGLVDLNEYMTARGLDLTDWHLRLAEDISADGRVIVGQGIRGTLARGFVIRLPEWCGTADFNDDTDFGTDADIEAFFACLAGNCCPTCWHLGADFNADGDAGTDADIEAFFRVLAGQAC